MIRSTHSSADIPALSLHALVPGYKHHVPRPVFEPLDLALSKGSLVCLLGANGAGKSTLLRTMAGLQLPLSGNVVLPAGRSSSTQIAVVLTDPVKITNMTVRELVTFGRYPYLGWNVQLTAEDQIHVENSIDRVNLRELADRMVNELSDGQRQMVMLARALAQDTEVLLLDEPTAHLDLPNRVRILRFLKDLAASGKAILIATHELDLALQTADRFWLVQDKKITDGVPEDLMLSGELERLFKIDGYHLSSGRIEYRFTKNVSLTGGRDHEIRWTRNALARHGIGIGESAEQRIEIIDSAWHVGDKRFANIEALLAFLR